MFNDQKEVKDSQNPEEKVEEKVEETEASQITSQPDQEELKTEIEKKSEEEVVDVAKVAEVAEIAEIAEIAEEPQEEIVKEEEAPVPVEVEEKKESLEDSNGSTEDMMTLLDEHFSKFEKGKIVQGRVVSVDEKAVLVDIGFKSESSIPIREFSSASIPKVGTDINVFIDSVEDGSGRLKLSKKKADFYTNLEKLAQIQKDNDTVEGVLRRRVKGGMIVEIEGLEAFLPGSQISTKPIPNLDQFIGKDGRFKILKIDEERRNIIVSRKKVILEEQEQRIAELKEKILEDAELDGEVRNITDYGAFIDLGGIDGLLHITDMSWGHIKHPSDMLNIGDKVKVKVLSYDEENGKVSLGLKQLVPHPWENIEVKYPEGTIVSGKVVNVTNYGVFVEIESGVEGLVHISEISWTKKIKHPKQVVKVGDSIKAIVLLTNKEEHRISLGIKQMEANPWLTIDDRYPIDSIVKGKVKTITPFGVFVEIEEDIEGLIHISDISWTKRIYHPKEVFQKGQEVEVKILSIDVTLHRIALGVKQLSDDPWENLDEKLPINTEITAKVAKIIAKGLLVDVEIGDSIVEGFVPLSHLGIPGLKKAESVFKTGEILPLKIIELDLENRRLILSVKAYFFAKDIKELHSFIKDHELISEPVEVVKETVVEVVKQVEEPVAEEAKETTTEAIEESVEEPVAEEVTETTTEAVEAVEEPVEEEVKETVEATKATKE